MTSARAIRLLPLALSLSGCAVHDSRIAISAQKRLIGMGEPDLQTCIGSPDQHSSFGSTDIITYEFSSSSSTSWSLPIVQGPSYSNGGNCRMTIRFDGGIADHIIYSGEKNGTGAPSAYCAPIVRSCLNALDALRQEKGAVVGTAPATITPPRASADRQTSSGT